MFCGIVFCLKTLFDKVQNQKKEQKMKKLVLICGILASALTVGYSAMSQAEIERARDNCIKNDKSACQELIDNGLASVKQCGKD